MQGLKSIGIAGSGIPGRLEFGRNEGAIQYGTRKIHGLLTLSAPGSKFKLSKKLDYLIN